jgi:hypothetical protein
VSDGEWVEVTSRQLSPAPAGADPWAPIDGSEDVILGDLATLTEGAAVKLAKEVEAGKAQGPKVASDDRGRPATEPN